LLALSAVFATGQPPDEASVRAAYVYNLTKYVEWPNGSSEIIIGFRGDDRAAGELLKNMLNGKQSDARLLKVWLNPDDEQLERCDVIYLAESPGKRTQVLLDRVRTRQVLTVAVTEDAVRYGAIIGLLHAGNQIHIQVNLEAAQQSGLKISSRLLSLATIVKSPRGGN
jgi:hypothetical protein